MKNPAISVIIPMYNTEKFIGECLQSLANQTFQDFEVLVADDCSTDNSINAAASFIENFGDRLGIAKLSENTGYSGVPRNLGLEAARGKYVYFIDSDDFITPTALEELYTVAENFNADVVHAEKYISVTNENEKFNFAQSSYQTGEFVTEPTLETFDIGERVTGFTQKRFLWNVWTKLFRLQFLRDNEITFSEVKVWEDFIFTLMCLVAAKNYVRVPFLNYGYRIRTDSISKKDMDISPYLNNIRKIIYTLEDFMNGSKFFIDNPKYKHMVINFFIQSQVHMFKI